MAASNLKLIVGLGNPGDEYHLTPHNLGFMAVDRLAEQRVRPVPEMHKKETPSTSAAAARRAT